MPYTKRYYVEITTLEPIDNNHFNEILKRNFEKSFIKLSIFDTKIFEEIKQNVKQSKQISIL